MFSNYKKILLLAIPSIFSFATATVTGTINLIIVGKLGATIIAIVGVTNIIMYNGWALFSGIGHTINYLVAQSYGGGNYRKTVERTYIGLYICIAVLVLVTAVGLIGSEAILRLIVNSRELAQIGADYVQLRFFALALGIFTFVFHGFMRGIGDTKTPAVLTVIGSVIMVFFTYAFTYGHFGFPELGLKGAGLGFLIGEAVGMIGAAFVYFVIKNKKFQTRSKVAYQASETKLILLESGKLGVQEFALSLSMFLFTMFVSRLGTEALAANEIALNIMSFGFMPAFAFGATATILVGHEIGRGDPLKGRRIGTDTAVLGGIFLLIIGVVEFLFAVPIAKIYTIDPAVYELVAKLITFSAFLQIFDGILNFYAGGLRGIGDTTFLMKASFICGFVVFVPLAYLFMFVFDWGSLGAWMSLYVFLTLFALILTVRFYRTDWMSVSLKSAE